MLELKGIKKDYPVGDGAVHALKGVDIQFRKSEFVAILGQSGCGKTTMLNIIGGLDSYTEGDLIINGRSTKEYKDRDWDTYRNHSVGFVFQSYNLIPHQSVLKNVELALTLSGVSKHERRRKAIKALESVGLGDQISKKPGEMSGGQMQRVAIARAIVNDPDIILADEPTGALDTETSLQVMEILKEISRDRLVVMVTHNPDLADRYASRTIRMLDGLITGDSLPLTDEEKEAINEENKRLAEASKGKKVKKPSMSFATSFMLSLNNLFTKKGRTALTSFAGSIGIIGIALILAVSEGMTAYIDSVQESTLSVYPLTLESSTVEMSSLISAFMDVASEKAEHENDAVYKKNAVYDMVKAMNKIEQSENDLKSFNEYLKGELKNEDSELYGAITGVQYTYGLDLQIYTKTVDGNILRSDLNSVISDLMVKYLDLDMMAGSSSSSMAPMASMASMSMSLWQQILPGKKGEAVNELLYDQYDVVYGSWPNEYDEIVLVVDENNEIDDITLYALGLLSAEEIDELANAALNGAELGDRTEGKWTYEEICGTEYRTVLNADCYHYDEATGLYTDLRENEAGLKFLYENALKLKITGIVRQKEDADAAMLSGNICYTYGLVEYLAEKGRDSETVKAQLASPDRDIITGKPFESTTGDLTPEEKDAAFRKYISSLSDAEKAMKYIAIKCIPSEEMLNAQIEAELNGKTREDIEKTLTDGLASQMSVSQEEIAEYLKGMSDEDITEIYTKMLTESIKAMYAQSVVAEMSKLPPEQLIMGLEAEMAAYTTDQCALYYDEIIDFSPFTYEDNLTNMGYVDLERPASINIYASSFENKDLITDAIDKYNSGVDEVQKIKYTDILGIMMSSITTIINAITYVLIAFVAISLIVSSIMIGVITLISVQERTKEIGILRAIGASKKNVSGMFNAETVIVGFTSGLLGVVVTYVLIIPINIILNSLTGIASLDAILPLPAALILILISMLLTLIAGVIPSRSAAKKDPVVALRTE